MFIVIIAITILSAISLITGFIWMLVDTGKVQRGSGADIGADMIADRLAEDEEDHLVVASGTIFKGKASSISMGTGYTFTEIKDLMARGQWRRAAPILMAMLGLIGFIFFGAVALLMGLEDKLVGGFMVIVVLLTLGRIAFQFINA